MGFVVRANGCPDFCPRRLLGVFSTEPESVCHITTRRVRISVGSLTYRASTRALRRRTIYPVRPPTFPPKDDAAAQPSQGFGATRTLHHIATNRIQYLADHIRFITHQGKQILLLDLSNCSSAEVETIFRAVPEVVTSRPYSSVLILSDFSGASITEEALRVMKETAVFDKPYVKKSAWMGTKSLPILLLEVLSAFSRRDFPTFETREQALAWLVKD